MLGFLTTSRSSGEIRGSTCFPLSGQHGNLLAALRIADPLLDRCAIPQDFCLTPACRVLCPRLLLARRRMPLPIVSFPVAGASALVAPSAAGGQDATDAIRVSRCVDREVEGRGGADRIAAFGDRGDGDDGGAGRARRRGGEGQRGFVTDLGWRLG